MLITLLEEIAKAGRLYTSKTYARFEIAALKASL